MIIQSEFRICVSRCTVKQASAGKWALAILCGTLLAACSGTIDTPTQEFPPREADSADDPPAAPARTPTAAAPAATTPRAPAATPPAAPAPSATPAAAPAAPAAADPVDEVPVSTADLSFENDIWPIFQESCSPCHQSLGSGGHNIGSDDLEEAFGDAVSFEAGIIADIEVGSMPIGCAGAPGSSGCVTEDDFAAIQAWYEAGAPE